MGRPQAGDPPRQPRARRATARALPGYDPGRERRAEQRARELLKSCVNEEEWAMYRDLGFVRVWGGESGASGERRAVARPARRPVRLPRLSAPPDRGLPPADRPAAQRVLRRVPRRDAALRLRAPAGLRRRAGQVDGAQGRRAAADHRGQHAPARPPDRPQDDPARHLAARPLGARAPRARRPAAPRAAPSPPTKPDRCDSDLKHNSRALTEGPHRAAARAQLQGHRLRRRGALQADHRRGHHLDRDDAVHLPPARAERQGQGGHPRRRRHADGVQHHRDLRRHHDGHRRDADQPRLARGDRRQDRARRQGPHVRRRRSRSPAATRRSPAP